MTTTGLPYCDGTSGVTWATVPPPPGPISATVPVTFGDDTNSSITTVTMTSPSVYLALSGLSAQMTEGNIPYVKLGSAEPNTVVALPPAELSSVVRHLEDYTGPWQSELKTIVSSASGTDNRFGYSGGDDTPWIWLMTQSAEPYNLFDLQRPVPASAQFFAALGWGVYPTDTIIRPDYHARIAVSSLPCIQFSYLPVKNLGPCSYLKLRSGVD